LEKYLSKDQAFIELIERIEGCYKCSLHREGQHQCPPLGNVNAKVLFVGEAPGRVDNPELRGLPFVGNRSSDLLLDAVYAAWPNGYDDIFVTNVVKCNPPMNRKPTNEEIEACHHFLLEEIRLVRPKIIVALGRTAANFFGIKENLNIARFKEYNWGGCLVIPKLHPAAILRTRNNQALLQYKWEIKSLKKRSDEL
jgi:uracil-DNA glycosylase family 4